MWLLLFVGDLRAVGVSELLNCLLTAGKEEGLVLFTGLAHGPCDLPRKLPDERCQVSRCLHSLCFRFVTPKYKSCFFPQLIYMNSLAVLHYGGYVCLIIIKSELAVWHPASFRAVSNVIVNIMFIMADMLTFAIKNMNFDFIPFKCEQLYIYTTFQGLVLSLKGH